MKVYLDYNAATPLDPRVGARAETWRSERFGNASSRDHSWGWDAAEAVEDARTEVAEATGTTRGQVVFLGSATEALNTVIRSYVGLADWHRKLIVTCATEHDAVLAPSRHLCERTGATLKVLPVDPLGHIDLEALRAAMAPAEGALVALMAANNEVGTLHPIGAIADIAHEMRGLFLCDTTQGLGKLALDLRAAGVDFATVSAHKIHGPKGVGALLVREGLEDTLEPLILGGGQERGLRGGTLDVPGIVGLGEACRLVREELDADVSRVQRLRDRLEDGILAQVPETWVNGDRANRLCNTSNMGFRGIDARTMIRDMHDVAVSTRSACSSGRAGPSHVLSAMGLTDQDAYACARFSLGRFTTRDEIDYAIERVVASVHKLRRAKSVRA